MLTLIIVASLAGAAAAIAVEKYQEWREDRRWARERDEAFHRAGRAMSDVVARTMRDRHERQGPGQ